MKYIKTNLHPVMLRFLTKDDYDHPDGISATSLIDSPKVIVLSKRHRDEIVIDPRMGWKANVGSAVHAWMENRSESDEDTETRLYAEVMGTKISGKYDMLKLKFNDDGMVELNDYKTFNALTFKDEGIKVVKQNGQEMAVEKWVKQFSTYRYLLHKNGVKNVAPYATVHCFILGWTKYEANRKNDWYPLYDCFSGKVPLMSYDATDAMIAQALVDVSECELLEDLAMPDCTEQETWCGNRCRFSLMPSGEWQLPWCPVWRWCKQRDSGKDPDKNVIDKIMEVDE